ncbi:MAG: PEBP family protein, partial [Planctomycetota bacterium]
SATFSTDDWPQATEFSARVVRPKDGYDRITWRSGAELIWSDDLKKDNTVLFRLVVPRPQ